MNVHADGQLVFNSGRSILRATLAGFGLAFLPDDMVQPHISEGRLERVLEEWCPPYSGHHLNYPSRLSSPAFKFLVEALRYQEQGRATTRIQLHPIGEFQLCRYHIPEFCSHVLADFTV